MGVLLQEGSTDRFLLEGGGGVLLLEAAADTAEKRRNASGIPYWPMVPGVTPNATKDQEWRAQSGWSWSAIPAAEPVIVIPSGNFVRRKHTRLRAKG